MNFWFDFKYAVRLLMKKPAFTALTVAVMACGLGLCIYNFSFIYISMFKPLPFEHGERMVVVDIEINGVLHNGGQIKFANFQDVKERNTSFEMFGAMQQSILTVSGGDNAVSYRAVYSTPELFNFAKVTPLLGRVFNATDDTPGANSVAVIGYDLWQNYFAGRNDVVGQQFNVEGKATEIIGVMPAGYLFPRSSQLWLPIQFETNKYTRGNGPQVQVYGLLKPGITQEQANLDMAQIMKQINSQYPEFNNGESLVANTFMISMMGNNTVPILIVMMTAVGFVLLLACINVGNLLYARSTERAKETAIRVALGALQKRLILQMLWESLIICSLGGVFALLMAAYGLELTHTILPSFINGRPPFWWDIKLDASLIYLTVGLTVATALITGMLPARKIIQGDFNAVLRDGTRGAQSRKAKKVAQALVIFEVTLSVALLTASSVMTYAVNQATNTDYGAKTTEILTAQLSLPEKQYDTVEKRLNYLQTLNDVLVQQPGVEGVAIMSATPAQNGAYRAVVAEGFELAKDASAPRANTIDVMPGSLETFEYKLLQGRFFNHSDNAQSTKVVVVSDLLAKKFWPNATDIIGKRIKWTGQEDEPWYQVIGVVANVIHGQPFADFKYRAGVYRSALQIGNDYMTVAVKTHGDANQLRPTLLSAFDSVDKEVPAFRIKTMEQVLARNTAGISFMISQFVIFGICATLLAGSGIYALMSNAIGQRTQEFGVRRALGATDHQVVKMLMKQGMTQLLIGTLLGLPIAFVFGNMIMSLIGVSGWGVYVVFAVIPLFIAFVVLMATWLPAVRVTRLEPNVALRYE